MIPSVEEIVSGVMEGRYTCAQAVEWLNALMQPPPIDWAQERCIYASQIMAALIGANPPFSQGIHIPHTARDAVNCADALIFALSFPPKCSDKER